jgi:hypothetical protein
MTMIADVQTGATLPLHAYCVLLLCWTPSLVHPDLDRCLTLLHPQQELLVIRYAAVEVTGLRSGCRP